MFDGIFNGLDLMLITPIVVWLIWYSPLMWVEGD